MSGQSSGLSGARRMLAGLLLTGFIANVSPASASETVWDIRVGLGEDFLQWNIASDLAGVTTPNILSELTWDNLQSAQHFIGMEHYYGDSHRFALLWHVAYAHIFSGDNQDSDYFGNNRTQEFSRSNNSADDSSTFSYSVALGFNFGGNSKLIAMPMLGFAEHQQNMRMTDGFQTIPNIGAFSGLDSTYDATWNGPWAGFRFGLRGRVSFYVDYRYHSVDYEGVANWNLRTDFQHPVSFTHEADASGQTVTLALLFQISESSSLGVNYLRQDWESDSGIDRTYFSDNSIAEIKLNKVVWTSDAVTFNIHYRF